MEELIQKMNAELGILNKAIEERARLLQMNDPTLQALYARKNAFLELKPEIEKGACKCSESEKSSEPLPESEESSGGSGKRNNSPTSSKKPSSS